MPRFPTCRLLIDPVPQIGAQNMAIDAALLDEAAASGLPTVRWYRWLQPTVSLGYFQSDDAAAPWRDVSAIDVVRRLTGGGAILHHHEWTYSVTLPALSPLLRHPYDLYDVVHNALCRSLEQHYGVHLAQRGVSHRTATEPVLCYQREDAHDVCLDGNKIIGSAQRRRRGALLQHGSILLQHSVHAPDVTGLFDLRPQLAPVIAWDDARVAHDLADAIAEVVVSAV